MRKASRMRGRLGLRLALLLVCATAWAQAPRPGAQTSAVPAPLRPTAITYDASGNAYFADADRHTVYEATLGGALVAVAGNGTQGFAGDGGAATSAELNAPSGIALDATGNMYIADTGNQRIRVVSGVGIITTIAGTGVRGFSGDGSAATSARLASPTALTIDATGALLLCDTGNHRVRRVSGGVISTIAGTGVQGFAGDGAAATSAQLDGPQGIVAAPDGRIFVADTRNQRIRVISTAGIISTFAGSGARGFSGDGGAATAAQLDLPRGLVLTAAGALIFADTDNHRIRAINSQGIVTTLAGSGVQGTSGEGIASLAAWLNAPRAVALSSFGQVALADSANRAVQVQAADSNVYRVAALVPSRSTSVTLTGSASVAYGQWSGQAMVAGSASTPLGQVQLVEVAATGSSIVSTATLSGGSAALSATSLAVGPHTLRAVYAGDGINPTATSTALSVAVQPATVMATATSATMLYGAAIPSLTGTITGVLPQDAANVAAVFGATAQTLSPVGTYPITATLTGSAAANYAVTMTPGSGSLTITQAPTSTSLPTQVTGSYAGVPTTLRAVVASSTSGTPTGTVSFAENGVAFAQATLVGGLASASYTAASSGTHAITATYSGDRNFLASTSAVSSIVLQATPDFTVASSGTNSQTVPGGSTATYALLVSASPAPFTGVVTMSVTGLPTGAIASFSPTAVVPGTGSAAVTLSITPPLHSELLVPRRPGSAPLLPMLAVVCCPCLMMRRRRGARWLAGAIFAVMALVALQGCGSRTVYPNTATSTTYSLTVMGTGTNIAGTVVSHSTPLTLIVE